MRIKKFVAHSLKEATDQMKAELGPEAIVISSRKTTRGGPFNFLGREAYEVTGAIDDTPPAAQNTYRRRSGGAGFGRQLEQSRASIDEENALAGLRRVAEHFGERQSDDARSGSTGRRRPDPTEMVELRTDMEDVKGTLKAIVEHLKYSRMPALPDTLQKAYGRLVQHDVDERLAADIIQSVYARLSQDQMTNKLYLEKQLLAAIAGIIPTVEAEKSRRKKTRVIALVGPTGVGKTTTIAKLAAINKLLSGLEVGLISADTYRIGAIEQLRTFAGIADIPMDVVYKPVEMGAALKKFRTKDVVFVDTVGRSQRSKKELYDLAKFVFAADPDETHLVLNASTNVKTCEEIIDQFKVVKPNRLIFSKLDEAATYGPMLSIIHRHHLPLSYVTTGQAVPDDIRRVEASQLAAMVYSGEMAHA
ncbi:MAG: Flagellar biosynthesis protein FlhF [Bacteroidetes bacterium]|nr:Flagellar biosynthesis protein FlhF [Bacteroidota bacterium]